ncbi:phage integrase SAM-like domain-containing protein [Phocaeicola vulgatus]|uniref:phage integrase SAM-like domain-containing protein n=1 Tax=Phocaeicola vulgatus TaxID=821 RepID=UPI0023072FD1|nr:phage integrase SAM-like domain-containing protein [Phocaeicola vulgatus]MDB1076859.1 phage integrase SAM-like domain-containing protein [Phocaeicola vulgatus]
MKKKSNLTLFMKQLIRSLKEEERFSTAHIYQSTLNAFMLFCKTDAIRFNRKHSINSPFHSKNVILLL